MKNLFTKISYLIAFCFGVSMFGQFNTLMPSTPSKKETNIFLEEEKNDRKEINKEKKEKKSLKKILNFTTKSELKNEIDSLKDLIKDFSTYNKKKWHTQQIRDSIALEMTNSISNQSNKIDNTPYNVVRYEYLSEPKNSNAKIVMPIKNKLEITSPYGSRTHPIFGIRKMHNGIDLKANYEQVLSVFDGVVSDVGWDSKGGGNYIKINHFNRFETAYLHLSEIYYRTGERVKAGFVIGKSGNSGNSTGPHLHFSVKEFGQSINPARFLNELIKVNNLIAISNE